MSICVNQKRKDALGEQQKEIRELVLEGYRQVQEGKCKDYQTVFDRLEKKYTQCSDIK